MRYTPGVYVPPAAPLPSSSGGGQRHAGHAHFWQRALSRRQVILSAAGGSAAALASGLVLPRAARAAKAASSDPRPIPETLFGNTPFHVLDPGGEEPSSITDFNGFIGATDIQGTGTGGLLFDLDMRFMKGVYVGVDDQVHQGTFGFV
ncbi:MAG TPA: hypothetical protein VGR57_13430 [Ktedonobacterales bacterium]|nr:hypothetical protein [Ktedonobacterales bacterium]